MPTVPSPSRRARQALAGVAAVGLAALAPLLSRATADPAPAAGTTGATGATGPAGPGLGTDLPCYLPGRSVRITARGLTPHSTYTVTLDGRPQGSGTVGADGTVTGTLAAPTLPHGATHSRHAIAITAAGRSFSASLPITLVGAGFEPSAGDPTALLVRFAIFGLGLGPAAPLEPLPREVYLHYLEPGGAQRYVTAVGRTHGPCGSIPTTRHHHLFPFRPSVGLWHLQFDLSASFSASSTPRVVRGVLVG